MAFEAGLRINYTPLAGRRLPNAASSAPHTQLVGASARQAHSVQHGRNGWMSLADWQLIRLPGRIDILTGNSTSGLCWRKVQHHHNLAASADQRSATGPGSTRRLIDNRKERQRWVDVWRKSSAPSRAMRRSTRQLTPMPSIAVVAAFARCLVCRDIDDICTSHQGPLGSRRRCGLAARRLDTRPQLNRVEQVINSSSTSGILSTSPAIMATEAMGWPTARRG